MQAWAKNTDYRQREYLTEGEISALVETAGNSRNPVRDRLLILMVFRHALRVSELMNLRWEQVHLDTATVHIKRVKNGTPGTPPAFPCNCRLPQVRFRCDSMPQSDPEHNQNLSNVNGITDG